MSAPSTRRGNLLVVSLILLLSIVFEQFGIAPFFPQADAAGTIRPMIVFLDIPLALPAISWLPVTILFYLLYRIVIAARLSRSGRQDLVSSMVWKALTGWWLLLGCIAAGGGIYYLIQSQGYLPKQVANAIDSFGICADITLPYPSGELIHLHGGMIELLFALLGLHWMARLTALPLPAQAITETTAIGARAVAEAQAIINTPQPKPTITTIRKTPRREPVLESQLAASKPLPARTPQSAPTTQLTASQAPAASQPPPTRRSSISVTPPPPSGRPAPSRQEPASSQQAPATQGPAFPGEPPMCRLTTPPPIAVVMPRRAPGIGKTHPCFVMGGLKPHPSRSS